MAEDRGYGILLFGIGALFGGFIVYIIMQKLQTSASSVIPQLVPSQIVPQPVPPQIVPQTVPPQIVPQTVPPQIVPQVVPQIEVVPPQIVPQVVLPQVSQAVPPHILNRANDTSIAQQEKIYKNNEKWQIERGPDGRIKSLNVIRDAKINS